MMNDDAIWCANAYQDEKPTELQSAKHCNSVGTVLMTDPNSSWSGYYCADCSRILVDKGWSLSKV